MKKMRLKTGYELTRMGDEYVAVPVQDECVNFTKVVSFNSSAAYLMQSLAGQEFDVCHVAQILETTYSVDRELACRDAELFIQSIQEAELVEEV